MKPKFQIFGLHGAVLNKKLFLYHPLVSDHYHIQEYHTVLQNYIRKMDIKDYIGSNKRKLMSSANTPPKRKEPFFFPCEKSNLLKLDMF